MAAAWLASMLAGCSLLQDPDVPGPIRTLVSPDLERNYLLYRPSRYEQGADWPLIVVCHGGFPDSAESRMRAWASLGEKHGFLVAAPTIEGAAQLWTKGAGEQLARQRRDERHILSVVAHVQAGQSISKDRIFIHGWSEGASAVIHTGLRHNDVFRAISLTRPSFDEAYAADIVGPVDPHQLILVRHDVGDVLWGNKARKCVEWLRSKQAAVTDSCVGTIRKDDPSPSVEFIKNVILRHPWIHVRASLGQKNPREVAFRLDCSFRPVRYRWSFGDGTSSSEAEPAHIYAGAGSYEVSVTIHPSDGEPHTRTAIVNAP
jgi:hypothetical protein